MKDLLRHRLTREIAVNHETLETPVGRVRLRLTVRPLDIAKCDSLMLGVHRNESGAIRAAKRGLELWQRADECRALAVGVVLGDDDIDERRHLHVRCTR